MSLSGEVEKERVRAAGSASMTWEMIGKFVGVGSMTLVGLGSMMTSISDCDPEIVSEKCEVCVHVWDEQIQ